MGLTGLRPSRTKDHSKKSKRKVEKKLQFHAKVKDAVVALGVKKAISKSSKSKRKRRQKKLKAYDLSSLAEFLPDLAASQHPPEATITKLNSKSRKKMLQRESVQLKAVLNNPTFQMDPVSAIQYHLEKTQPPPLPMDANRDKKRNRPGKSKKKSKSRKKGANESSLGPQSHMDI